MFRRKITIKVSRILIRTAIEDAAMYAVHREIERQIREQVKGTQLEGCGITVEGCEQYTTITWPAIPDSHNLTFVYVD